jgi:hypothetical protein
MSSLSVPEELSPPGGFCSASSFLDGELAALAPFDPSLVFLASLEASRVFF